MATRLPDLMSSKIEGRLSAGQAAGSEMSASIETPTEP
jgi:hypothetical protein